MSSPLCQFLQWDTDFFGFRIARVSKTHLGVEDIDPILDWCARERIRCLYLLVAGDDSVTTQLAEDHRFHLTDIRVTFERMRANVHQVAAGIRPVTGEDVPSLVTIAQASHSDSRFYHDHQFPRERSAALYGAWIEKSCRGYAQAVLVAERDAKPAGYVTCHWQGTTGQIGLIAVAEWARGVGIGGNLVDAAVHTFEKAGASHTTVVTQGRNLASQRLYQKRGFITKSVELWYHLWFPSAE